MVELKKKHSPLLALFLLSSCSLLALFLPSSSSLPPLYTETLPQLSRTYPLPSPFLAPSYPLELRSNLLTLGIAQTSLALRSLTRNFVYDCGTDQIHAPFNHHSCTIQPPFNHHSRLCHLIYLLMLESLKPKYGSNLR